MQQARTLAPTGNPTFSPAQQRRNVQHRHQKNVAPHCKKSIHFGHQNAAPRLIFAISWCDIKQSAV
jgi:hypothetical protein